MREGRDYSFHHFLQFRNFTPSAEEVFAEWNRTEVYLIVSDSRQVRIPPGVNETSRVGWDDL